MDSGILKYKFCEHLASDIIYTSKAKRRSFESDAWCLKVSLAMQVHQKDLCPVCRQMAGQRSSVTCILSFMLGPSICQEHCQNSCSIEHDLSLRISKQVLNRILEGHRRTANTFVENKCMRKDGERQCFVVNAKMSIE